VIDCRRSDNRQLVAKVAILWQQGDLPEDDLQQLIESYERKRKAGRPVQQPPAWLWGVLRDKCERRGVNFDQLLKETAIPAALLGPPAAAAPPAG